jgi:hypothetical protein
MVPVTESLPKSISGSDREGIAGNLHYDLPVTLKGGEKKAQDRPE